MVEQNMLRSGEDKPLSGLLSQAPERAVLVGVDMPGNGWPVEESVDELAQLATTAGVTCVDRVVQRLARPHPGTLLGSGKIQEIADLVRFHDCDAVIFDLELSPGQHRTLESALETQVLDRTALILMTPPAARTPSPEGQAVAPVQAGREGGFRAATCPTYRPGEEGGHHGRTRI